ncbi:MAG: CBS domain-containing protein [Candidatus Kerfeldbacteria bacterium]|nr:CBS domain-containing protein [Candidatus Kerfeldbacteria bacterium]
MKVAKIMRKRVATIPLGTTIRDAARLLVEKGVTGAPVVDERKRVIGIVSEKDLFRALYPSEEEFMESPEIWADDQAIADHFHEAADRLVEEVMMKDVIAVTPDTSVTRVGAIMLARNIHRLPVMEGGKLKGIVSRRDVYHFAFKRELKI